MKKKLTKSELRNIITEEIRKVLSESVNKGVISQASKIVDNELDKARHLRVGVESEGEQDKPMMKFTYDSNKYEIFFNQEPNGNIGAQLYDKMGRVRDSFITSPNPKKIADNITDMVVRVIE